MAVSTFAAAQEKREKAPKGEKSSKSEKADKADKSDKPATPAAEFTKLYREFKEVVARLSQIQQKYNSDPMADKKALEDEFNTKVEQAKDLEAKLAVAGEKAYLAAPNKDREQNDYLFARLNKLVATDDYDDAAKLAKMLLDHGSDQKYLNLLAGLACFGSNDFESAEKYLKLADEKGELTPSAQVPAAGTGKETLKKIQDHNYKEMWAQEQALRETEAKAGDLPKVKLATSKGDVVVELFENQAPIAVNNFVNLVEKKFYDGTRFHRVLPGFMAQGGDPNGDGSGGPDYTIPDEYIQENHRNHFRGSLSMARTGQRDSGGSQFFLCFQPVDHLDGKYTVFGRVVEGFDVLAKLQRCQPKDSNTPDRIVKATVLSKRNHKYEPSIKLPKK